MASKEFEDVVQILKSLPDAEGLTLQERRDEFENTISQFPGEDDVAAEPLDIGGLSAEWLTPSSFDGNTVILYLHGGGYCEGSMNTHRGMAARISKAANAKLLLVDYRLAPENPFPAAVEDSRKTYKWMIEQGIRSSKLIIAGDSAGGGLTVATLLNLKAAGEPLPAAAVCISPWVDLEGTGESIATKAEVDLICEKNTLLEMAQAYLGGTNFREPLASPLYGDLKGLPPLLIQVGTSEILLSDSTRLAEKAREAGVEVVLETWEEMLHVWHFFAFMLPEGMDAIEGIGRFIKKHTG